ncbi:hypothetical protein FF011L_28700 [Roseimaritima multifibrata]|uniref:Uncharacterized protein n=1 Tax=Roseimaritima multifibrata TaxID=1930274 RepID=A0A517MGS4_9BACT|nr:hypothetical protein [Roseimaritima multifibrata]QDS94092.1 hypothetical protein FF011L_28700 [Roseimaritima multifibrata]
MNFLSERRLAELLLYSFYNPLDGAPTAFIANRRSQRVRIFACFRLGNAWFCRSEATWTSFPLTAQGEYEKNRSVAIQKEVNVLDELGVEVTGLVDKIASERFERILLRGI